MTAALVMVSSLSGRGVGRGGGGAKGAIAPPFFRGKEQNLQLTGVELAPWSFQQSLTLFYLAGH